MNLASGALMPIADLDKNGLRNEKTECANISRVHRAVYRTIITLLSRNDESFKGVLRKIPVICFLVYDNLLLTLIKRSNAQNASQWQISPYEYGLRI